MHIFKKTNYDFLRWRWHAIAMSWAIIIAGIITLATKGIPLGVEFAGGTSVIVQFDKQPSIEQIRASLGKTFGQDVIVQTYGAPSQRQIMIRAPHVGGESGTALANTANQIRDALTAGNLGNPQVVGTEIVGPAVGQELRTRGLEATVLSLIGILAYLAFRFQFSFGVGAVVATIHDLLITLAFLAFFRYEMSINISINQTLGRTVITSGTALLTALALFFFGGEVLHGFAFTMVVGIITGTYSSVFIAAAIVSFWRSGQTKAVTRAPAAAPAPAATQQPTRKSKPQRKARAS